VLRLDEAGQIRKRFERLNLPCSLRMRRICSSTAWPA
jgi:hypothetical protein